jgi:hypothetical protein
MARFLKVMGLWSLFSVAGFLAVGLGTWALAVAGAEVLMMPFLVLGLACVLPVSLAVADNMPSRPHRDHPGGPDPSPMLEMVPWFFH